MIKFKSIEITDYKYTTNRIVVEFDGLVDNNKVIPLVMETLELNEVKDGTNNNNNN